MKYGKIEIVKHVIDMDFDPCIPDHLKIESHKKGGQFEWDPEKVQLYLSAEQQDEKYIEGNKLCKELEAQLVYNANLLDYLLDYPELIPEEWKGKYIFFWGTIYRGSNDRLYVQYLYFDGEFWDCDENCLNNGFYSGNPAAVAGKF